METNTNVSESAPKQDESVTQSVNESVTERTPEDLSKRLKEVTDESVKRKHKLREKEELAQSWQSKYEELEREKQEEQGQWKDLYEKEKERRVEVETKKKQDDARAVWDKVTSQVKQQAAAMNCLNPDDLVRLLAADKVLDGIDYDKETYKVNEEELKNLLEKAKEQKGYLFGKPAPNVHAGYGGSPKNEPTDTAKMSVRELAALAAESMKQLKNM